MCFSLSAAILIYQIINLGLLAFLLLREKAGMNVNRWGSLSNAMFSCLIGMSRMLQRPGMAHTTRHPVSFVNVLQILAGGRIKQGAIFPSPVPEKAISGSGVNGSLSSFLSYVRKCAFFCGVFCSVFKWFCKRNLFVKRNKKTYISVASWFKTQAFSEYFSVFITTAFCLSLSRNVCVQ